LSSSRRRDQRSGQGEGLGSVFDQLMGERPWRSGMALGELERRWLDVVGERLAKETRPASLEGGLLLVRASSQAWAAQVNFLADEVRTQAQDVLGADTVTSVRVVVDTGVVSSGRRR
jgi:predicted nucleic acid-binding Zn ribbon protein